MIYNKRASQEEVNNNNSRHAQLQKKPNQNLQKRNLLKRDMFITKKLSKHNLLLLMNKNNMLNLKNMVMKKQKTNLSKKKTLRLNNQMLMFKKHKNQANSVHLKDTDGVKKVKVT